MRNINSLLKGIQMLNSCKLSFFIIPPERLQTVLNNIWNDLLADFDSFHILSKDASYYYQNAKIIYGRQENVININISFPIVRMGNFEIYNIFQFLIHLNFMIRR